MAEDNTSSVKAYMDSAKAGVQSVISSITGNSTEQASAQASHNAAASEHNASHTVAKLGPVAASPSGGVAVDDPDRSAGSWNQTVGSGKAMMGNALGMEGLRREGEQQNREGQGQEARGQLRDAGHGMQDRVQGAAGAAWAGLTGDREGQERFNALHDDGKTQLRSAQADIEKKADY